MYMMRCLIDRIDESKNDEAIHKLIATIRENKLDQIFGDILSPNTKDIDINHKIDELSNDFYQLIRILETKGYITISGYQIIPKNNI